VSSVPHRSTTGAATAHTTALPIMRPDPARGPDPRRRPGPIGIAIIVATILAAFGLGAALFSPILAARSGSPAGQPARSAPAIGGPPVISSESPSAEPSTSSAASVAGNTALEDAAVDLINTERAKARCQPLREDERLRQAARGHSTDLAGRADRSGKDAVSQTGSDGSSYDERIRAAGYPDPFAEVVASGVRTAKDALSAWTRGRNDRATIVDCAARAIGVGVVARRSGTLYWTADFGS